MGCNCRPLNFVPIHFIQPCLILKSAKLELPILLSDLDPHGPDKLPTRLLKLLSNEISPSLTLLFTASLHQGTVPQDWKKTLATSLFKKGERSNPANYRPTSLTRYWNKILEQDTGTYHSYKHYETPIKPSYTVRCSLDFMRTTQQNCMLLMILC